MASFSASVYSFSKRVSGPLNLNLLLRYTQRRSSAYAPVLLERKAARMRQEMEQDTEKGHQPKVIRTVFESADRQYVCASLSCV